jgi:hypothetical protein
LRAAELRLRETLATGDATRASYYPDFSLTGSLGSSSSRLAQVLSNPLATLGRHHLAVLAVAADEAEQQHQRCRLPAGGGELPPDFVFRAGRCGQCPVRTQQYRQQGERLTQAPCWRRGRKSCTSCAIRRAAPLKDWLDAQETRRTAEVSLLENRYNRLVNQVTLYQALGGGTQLR